MERPRTGCFALVVALHVAIAAAVLSIPAVRERLTTPPAFVSYIAPLRPPEPMPKPLARPTLHEAPHVQMPMPPVALAPEIQATPPPQPAPAISGPIFSPKAPPAPAVPEPVEPPRFDMAYLRNPAPSYPPVSRRMGEQGRVILRVLVSARGDPEDVEVRTSSGSDRLDRAAMDAVRRWRFAPAHRGAEAIAAWALVPILFQLDT